jgi:hypothetical protein
MSAYHRPPSPNGAARAIAAARKLLRENGAAGPDLAEKRGDEARKSGNRTALHHWRRTARCLAALLRRGGTAPAE